MPVLSLLLIARAIAPLRVPDKILSPRQLIGVTYWLSHQAWYHEIEVNVKGQRRIKDRKKLGRGIAHLFGVGHIFNVPMLNDRNATVELEGAGGKQSQLKLLEHKIPDDMHPVKPLNTTARDQASPVP